MKASYFGGIVAILLALAGCQSEKYVDDGSSQPQQFTLTASKAVMSRTHLGSDGKQTLWSMGDEIYVSSADGKVKGILTLNEDDANKTTGTFGGLVTGDPALIAYAVYPVPNDDMTIDLSKVTGGDKLNAPMVGKVDVENRKVTFENTCGMLRLNLQNANGKNFTISAKSNDEPVKFLTTATVMVNDEGVPSMVYSASGDGTVSLENAVGGFMYMPYFINQDVTIYVDRLDIAHVEAANFIGKLKQKDVKTLTYSETTAGLIEPAKVDIKKDENVEGETLKLDISSATSEPGEGETTAESHEFVNIPSITEALTGGEEGAEVTISEVVVELPKIDETSSATKSVVSFEEIPQGVTVTIQEEETENKSLEELTVILPSTETEAEAKEAIDISMPNTTVTVKSTDGKTLYIKNVSAATFDETLIVDQNVEISALTVLKGGVQVFGKIGQLMRDAENKDSVTVVTIEVGGSIGQLVGEGFSVENKNPAEEVKEDFVEEEDGSYTINTAAGWKTFASMINGGNTFEGKTIRLGADIDLNNEVQAPIGVKESINQINDIIFAGTLDGQNYAIKNLKIENTIGRFTGLFAYIQKATFMNLRLVGGEVKGNSYVGALVGYGRGVTIINCHNEGCKVTHMGDEGSYAGGLTGCLNRTNDGTVYSYIIASTNSAEVSGAYCPAGITGGAWGGYVTLVACVNTGEISYSGTQTGQLNIYAAGIASSLGGNAWMYGCFSDCDIVPDGYNHSGLVSDLGYTGENFHYSYSANTNLPPLTFGWGGSPVNKTVGHSTYGNAVDNLNKGIQLYNWTATVPCTYKFVKGDKPTLVYAEPSTSPGSGNNNFGNGGKF